MNVELNEVGNFLSDFTWKRRDRYFIHQGGSYVDGYGNTGRALIEEDCDAEINRYLPLVYPKDFSTLDISESASGLNTQTETLSLGDPNAFFKFAQLFEPRLFKSTRNGVVIVDGVWRSEAEILSWLSSYGLPYNQAPDVQPLIIRNQRWPGSSSSWDHDLQQLGGPLVISLSEFRNCSLRAYLALHLWDLIKKQDWGSLAEWVGGTSDLNTANIAYNILIDIIQSHVQNVPLVPRLIPTKRGFYKIEQSHRPKDLLGALWFQFLSVVAGSSSLTRCKECGLLFVPNKVGQLFCPPPPRKDKQGTDKSPCLNRYSVKRNRQKQKIIRLYQKGTSIDQIINETGVLRSDLIKWIEEFNKNETGKKKSRQKRRRNSNE